MWLPKLLLPPVKIRIFGPKTAIFPQNMHSWAHIGPADSGWWLVVDGCGARAVTRKTPIYFYIGTKRVTLMDILSNLPQIVGMVDSSFTC